MRSRGAKRRRSPSRSVRAHERVELELDASMIALFVLFLLSTIKVDHSESYRDIPQTKAIQQIVPRLADMLDDGVSSLPGSEIASNGSLEELHHETELRERESHRQK